MAPKRIDEGERSGIWDLHLNGSKKKTKLADAGGGDLYRIKQNNCICLEGPCKYSPSRIIFRWPGRKMLLREEAFPPIPDFPASPS